MLTKLFNARSPFWQLLIYVVFFYATFLIVQSHNLSGSALDSNRLYILTAAAALLSISTAYGVQIVRYNRSHPQHRIRYWGFLPPELKEEDEGMRMFTARATRQVYVFHATILPLYGLICIYFFPSLEYVTVGLALLVIGHFGIYLATIWPVLGAED